MFGWFKKEEKVANCEAIYKEYAKYKKLYGEAESLLTRFVNTVDMLKEKLFNVKEENVKLTNELEKLEKENERFKKELKNSNLLIRDLYEELNKKQTNNLELEAAKILAKLDKVVKRKEDKKDSIEKEITIPIEEVEKEINDKPQTLKEVKEYLKNLDIKV